jgi:SAM-dependent methyltransferase
MLLIPAEREQAQSFAAQYQVGQTTVMREMERSFCGCDYGGTSWTTRQEAEQLAHLLKLGPGARLLEVGAGSGWPALYVAKITGCDTTLTDIPPEGLRIAARRAVSDGLVAPTRVAAANGAALPFSDRSFDAISHSDVLCCLDAKLGVLQACRRVIRSGGRMVFTVISIASDLSAADHERAADPSRRSKAACTAGSCSLPRRLAAPGRIRIGISPG